MISDLGPLRRLAIWLLALALGMMVGREINQQATLQKVIAHSNGLARELKTEKLKSSRFKVLVRELEWEVKGLKAAAEVSDRALLDRMNRILKRDLEELEGDADE